MDFLLSRDRPILVIKWRYLRWIQIVRYGYLINPHWRVKDIRLCFELTWKCMWIKKMNKTYDEMRLLLLSNKFCRLTSLDNPSMWVIWLWERLRVISYVSRSKPCIDLRLLLFKYNCFRLTSESKPSMWRKPLLLSQIADKL